jgi:hypothetical protein
VDWSGLSPTGIHTIAAPFGIHVPNAWGNIKYSVSKLKVKAIIF